jgi:hypothetical protein
MPLLVNNSMLIPRCLLLLIRLDKGSFLLLCVSLMPLDSVESRPACLMRVFGLQFRTTQKSGTQFIAGSSINDSALTRIAIQGAMCQLPSTQPNSQSSSQGNRCAYHESLHQADCSATAVAARKDNICLVWSNCRIQVGPSTVGGVHERLDQRFNRISKQYQSGHDGCGSPRSKPRTDR